MRVKQEKIIRVVHFGNKDLLDSFGKIGGVEIVVSELTRRQAALGYDVTVYNRSDGQPDKAKRITEWQGVRMKYVPTIPKAGLAAVSASFFAAVCCALGKYDVVHVHAEGPAAFCWIPKLFGKRVIITNHGLDWQRSKWCKGIRLGSRFIRFGEKVGAKTADEMIVLSPAIQKYFKDNYDRDTHLIPNGISRPEMKPPRLITKKYGLQGQDYILYLSRITPEKRPDLLINAYRRLNTGKKLVIAGGDGDGGNSECFKNLKKLAQGDERIIFTDFISGRILEELYSSAYIYVLPSDIEGMPMCLLEAMSYGNCCLTSDIPECLNVMGTFGVSFKKGSCEALTKKLQMLLDDPETAGQIKAETADYVCRKYSWEDVVKQISKLYQK